MNRFNAPISADLREQVYTFTGHRFESISTLESLVLQLAKTVGLLKHRNQQLSHRIDRTKKSYEFAKLEGQTWREKLENQQAS
ncbi:MAG: hypothetical protein J7545_15565 [Roseofilum sp. SBFL]|uniref:hypothetical protein n=1 Tax=Roseofilum sp. SBFL TaxID=2821496 RepID=UPI001B037909|nr:hypothetical protein [Roseofilum sp. SBFL]MBP0043365.1 hypothetical protein [Roseofilum sp. SBFL]